MQHRGPARAPRHTVKRPMALARRTGGYAQVLWVSAQTLYGAREHPDEAVARIALSSWL